MRLMLKFSIPVEFGNAAIRDGKMGRIIEEAVAQVNAEAAYFTLLDGERGGLIFFEEDDQAKLPGINEKLFLDLGADIEITPVLTLEDLKRGLPGRAS